MIVIPAIDVRGGRCVRLRQGDYARETRYSADPEAAASEFIAAGASRLHIVDLDAARGRPDPESDAVVRRVVRAAAADGRSVQVGGGIRTGDAAQRWLAEGAAFVVLGSVAVREPALAFEICQAHEGSVLLALDTRDGAARVQGWTESGGAPGELLRAWQEWPCAGVIFTNTARDGMLDGPDLEGLTSCLALYTGRVYVSGGIRHADDVAACAQRGAAGVVVGRALHEGTVDLGDLLTRFPVPAT